MNPLRPKYYEFYQKLAEEAAKQSVAYKRVGAVIVTSSGLISPGWNGTPTGFDNSCEMFAGARGLKTKPEVIHAERNAIDKMTIEGTSTRNAILFTTTAPCMECAKSIHAVGIAEVFYRDKYKNDDGLDFLKDAGVPVTQYLPS
jgi:dCMP deaminase